MGARSPTLGAFGDDLAWSMLDATPDGILVVSAAGQIVFVSDQAAALLGYEAEDLLDRPVEDLLPNEVRRVHRAHRTRYVAEPTTRPMGAGLLLRARRADGSEFPVEVSLRPNLLGDDSFVVAAVRDVTERVAAEDHLHRVLRTLDASDEGVFIFDATSLRYSYVNEGAVRLVGYSRDELSAMSPVHLDPDRSELNYRRLVETLQAEPDHAVTQLATLVRKDGVDVPVETTFHSAPAGRDGSSWIITLARDISARLAAEEDLRRSQGALREAEQVLAVADDRERIARDLHDTVIQRLFGAGLGLQSTMAAVDEPTRQRLGIIVEELDMTIKDLRMAIFSLQGAAPSLGGLRGRLLEVLRETGPGLGFEPRLQFDGPVETIEDHVAEQLLATLREALSNVARHARATNARVALAVTDQITLTVTDDGVGMPEAVAGGRGLGNMAARADQVGGTFRITAKPGGGSCLTWQAPVSREPEPRCSESPIRAIEDHASS